MKSSVFVGLGANRSWERKTNPRLVRDAARVISIYGAKGMTLVLNAQTSQCALYPGDVLQCIEGAEIVSVLTLGLLDVSILARLPVAYIPNNTKTSQIDQTGMKQKISILFKAWKSVHERDMKTGSLCLPFCKCLFRSNKS